MTESQANQLTSLEQTSLLHGKQVLSIQVPPKQAGKTAPTEYCLLEHACFRVRVMSSTAYIPQISQTKADDRASKASSSSLEKYVQSKVTGAAAEGKKGVSELENNPVDDNYNCYDNYAFFHDEERVQGNPEEGAEESEQDLAFNLEDCAKFLDPVMFAKELVKNVVAESEGNMKIKPSHHIANEENVDEADEDDEDDDATKFVHGFEEPDNFAYVETKKSLVAWPTIATFNVQVGAFTIDEYLSYFETEEDWMYVIYYQGVHETQCSDLHRYQAIYSLPTWKYPVAQATASVFFTIEVCKAKPPYCLVDVTFKYETFGQVYKPGIVDFQEKWLQYILDAKIKIFQTITY